MPLAIPVNSIHKGGGSGPFGASFSDAEFRIHDDIDETKIIAFEASDIETGVTRTFTMPNFNTTLVGTDATQTLTNKTYIGGLR